MSKRKSLSNTMSENTRSNKMESQGLHIPRFSLIINIILTNDSHRNMYAPHSTFLDYIPASFWSLPILFLQQLVSGIRIQISPYLVFQRV